MDSSFNLAVHALVCLSHSGRSLSSEALAENICTNPTRVRRVMAGLKKAGIVETREGLDGGYRLCTDPAALSLRQVAEAINTRFVDCAWPVSYTHLDVYKRQSQMYISILGHGEI